MAKELLISLHIISQFVIHVTEGKVEAPDYVIQSLKTSSRKTQYSVFPITKLRELNKMIFFVYCLSCVLAVDNILSFYKHDLTGC